MALGLEEGVVHVARRIGAFLRRPADRHPRGPDGLDDARIDVRVVVVIVLGGRRRQNGELPLGGHGPPGRGVCKHLPRRPHGCLDLSLDGLRAALAVASPGLQQSLRGERLDDLFDQPP